MNTGTAVKKCLNFCKNEYQDEKYGVGKRVHNGTANDKWRCTVCEKDRD